MIKIITAADLPQNREEEKLQDKKRKKRLLYIALGVAAVLSAGTWWALQPVKGPPQVGICRTFAELHIQYPETLKVYAAERFERSWRLYYTYIGPFGENSANMIECRFVNDPQRGAVLEHVLLNRVSMPPKTIEAFNKTIPVVLAYKPSLVLPPASGNSLMGLKKGD